MTQIQIILLISIIIVIILLIDVFRYSKRKKYKLKMSQLQGLEEKERGSKSVNKLNKLREVSKNIDSAQKMMPGEDIKVNPISGIAIREFKVTQSSYPQLHKGIVNYYISAPRGYIFNGEDLNVLFKHYGLKFNAKEQSFELLTQDHDALFSIKSDLPITGFNPEKFIQTNYTRLLFTCGLAELSEFYEPDFCFKHFTKSIEKINKRLGGTLLNEHKRRFTSYDENAYKRYIKKLRLNKTQNYIDDNS